MELPVLKLGGGIVEKNYQPTTRSIDQYSARVAFRNNENDSASLSQGDFEIPNDTLISKSGKKG